MKTLICAVLMLVFVTPVAQADPVADVCHARARKESGYTGARPGLSTQAGRTSLRLSGSVAVGVSRSSGAQGKGTQAPGFAGQAAGERREDKAKARYTRIFDDCMRTR